MREVAFVVGLAMALGGCQAAAPTDRQTSFMFPGDPAGVTSHTKDGVYVEVATYPGRHRFAAGSRGQGERRFPEYADRRALGQYLNMGEASPDAVEAMAARQRDGLRAWPGKNWVISVGCDSLGCVRNSMETQHVDRDHPFSV